MNRFLDAESNGGIFIDIGCSERNILTCKVVGRKRNCTMRQKAAKVLLTTQAIQQIRPPYTDCMRECTYRLHA